MMPRWIVGPALAVCLLAYAQVVSGVGMVLWVVPSAVIALGAVAVVRLRLPHPTAGLAVWPVLLVTTVGWALVVETFGGQTSGPVTRSALLVGGLTGAMSAMTMTRYGSAFAAPAVALFCGALALGAAGGVIALTGAFAVTLMWGLLALGGYRLPDLRDRGRVGTIAAFLLLAGLVAVAATAVSASLMDRPWTIPGAGVDNAIVTGIDSPVEPEPTVSLSTDADAAVDPEPTVAPTIVAVTPLDTAATSVVDVLTTTVLPWLLRAALALLILLLLLLLYALARRVWATSRWRAMRRRLRAGSPNDWVLGAWAWVRLRLHQAQHDLPPSSSPDVVAAGLALGGVPGDVVTEMTKLARLAAAAAFAPVETASATGLRRADAARAWGLARQVELTLVRRRTLCEWWRLTALPPDERILASERGEAPESELRTNSMAGPAAR